MRDREMPDESNRYDGKPARKHPPEGPSPEEIKEVEQAHETFVGFVSELMVDAGVEEVVRNRWQGQEQLSINGKSFTPFVREQGRMDEFEELSGHMTREYGMMVVEQAAKNAGIPVRVEDHDEN